MKIDEPTQDAVVNELRQMVESRLLDGTWPISSAEVPATHERLAELGLRQATGRETFSDTTLGHSINGLLWRVFIGTHCMSEYPTILFDNGFIDEDEEAALYTQMEDVEAPDEGRPEDKWAEILRPVVRRAYLQFQAR